MTVRPHMAGILAIAFIFPHVFGANRTGMSGLALKVVGIPALVALTWLFVSRAATYVEMRDFSEGKAAVMQVARSNSGVGGSTYGGSLTSRMALAPFLLVRPFPFEVHNLQAAFASIRGNVAARHVRAAEKGALSNAGADQVEPVCHVPGAVHGGVYDHLRGSHHQFWPVEPAAGDVDAVYVNALSE